MKLSLAWQMLEFQEAFNLKALTLAGDQRWGSVLAMFQTVEANEPQLRQLASGADFLAGSAKQREKATRVRAIIRNGAFLSKLRNASAILKPICRAITLYQSDKVVLLMRAFVFRQIKGNFKNLKHQMVITEAECDYLYQLLRYRHGKAISPVHNLAALLDPRTYSVISIQTTKIRQSI